jgi:alpha-galactosidase
MKYIEGLYAYWDRIAATWPDSLRIECSSGGRRIDLETVSRMHIHQKSDYWFHNTTDQASIWGLSQYLPNPTFMAPINRLDDYTFHSVLPTSMCLGWIADAPDFDAMRAGELLKRYEKVKHLLIGAWYPLLPYSREEDQWMASQYHRRDLNEGMILVFRRPESPYRTVELRLHGLDPDADYELRTESTNDKQILSGQSLITGYPITLDKPHTSEMILYRNLAR